MSYAILFVVVAVGFSAIVQIFTDPRISGAFIWKSLLAVGIYLLHAAVGICVIFFLLPWNANAAGGAVTAILGWIALGTLGLIRFAPRLREPPRWLMHFGMADILCLSALTWGVADYAGLL
jgi:formate-dependent nitrite reductase membrane component NrfD